MTDTEQRPPPHADVPTDEQVHSVLGRALAGDSPLSPLKGFKMDLTANPDFRKVFFAARCDCGTAGLLSVEVAPDKTVEEMRRAAPELARRLLLQSESFHAMPCEMHAMMRMGPAGKAGEA